MKNQFMILGVEAPTRFELRDRACKPLRLDVAHGEPLPSHGVLRIERAGAFELFNR